NTSRGLADPRRRGRQDARRAGAREARGRLRLGRARQNGDRNGCENNAWAVATTSLSAGQTWAVGSRRFRAQASRRTPARRGISLRLSARLARAGRGWLD